MGVKKLFTFLNDNYVYKIYPCIDDLINELNLNKERIIIGVDANLFCYKYSHSYDNMIIGFLNQILKFLSNKIIPLYIFDGGTLHEKENTNLIRNQKKIISKLKLDKFLELSESDNNNIDLLLLKKKLEKNSFRINDTNIKNLLNFFDLLNIPYIFSHGEGEYLAVLLNKYNIIDFFLSDDTDPIPAGINKIIKFYNNNVYYLEINYLYKKLNISKEQFCDFCILLGTDYMSINHGLKPKEIFNLIIKYYSIENIIKNNNINNLNENSLEIINKIRNIYKYSDEIERLLFIDPKKNINTLNNSYSKNKKECINNINVIIDHSNIDYYSNIILEFWDDYIEILKIIDLEKNSVLSNTLKFNFNSYILKLKFNIKNIIKFIKNNIDDITEEEITNIIISFEFLNTFGFI